LLPLMPSHFHSTTEEFLLLLLLLLPQDDPVFFPTACWNQVDSRPPFFPSPSA
jgi:hypothetical protein